jgi:hypothetical protein
MNRLSSHKSSFLAASVFTVLLIVAAITVFAQATKSPNSRSSAAPPPAFPVTYTNLECSKWVEACVKDFESLHPGMTRSEVQARFFMDGGLQGISPVRFTHPSCPYFKVDVEFDFKRDANDQNRAIQAGTDRVIRVSKPYLERPYMD